MKQLIYLTFILIAAFLLTGCSKNPQNSNNASTQTSPTDEVLKNALNLYNQKKQEGMDFSKGPCLGTVGPDWVLDIAHNPRQTVDDQSENQCTDFKEGKAHHFIELDPEGKLIRSF